MKPNTNSFAAGFASALILVVIGSALAPAVKAWWDSVKGSGGMGMILLILAVGVGAWALGRTQTEGGPGPGGGPSASGESPNADGGPQSNAHSNTQNGYAAGGAPPPPPRSGPQAGAGNTGGQRPTGGWQRGGPTPGATNANGHTPGAEGAAKGAWERAREDTKRKEEERKAREAAQKRKEELEKKLREAREKEARERDARERRQKEEEARAKAKIQAEVEKELEKERERERERQRLREEAERVKLQEKLEREKEEEKQRQREKEKAEEQEREKAKDLQRQKDLEKAKLWEKRKEETKRLQAERERLRKEKAEKEKVEGVTPRGSSYAFSAVGEKTNPWPKGRPPSPTANRSQPPSPTKRPPPPTAKTYRGTEDDAYSFRPYDKPKRPMHAKAPSSVYSESSYAASQSTSRTTPPPSHRGPYTTKDPNKIVIKAVYSFNNAFQKTPTSQLVSGVGTVTDGLILRITTEGLFIDDDVRDVPQREWDVKAWTMKLVEVWCPSFRQGPAGNSASARVASSPSPHKYNPVRRLWGMDRDKSATPEETDALLVEMLQLCSNNCRSRSSSIYSASSVASSVDDRSSVSDSAYGGSSIGSSPAAEHKNKRTDKNGVFYQTGELKAAKLHVLRASIRDQEGKKYVFVIDDTESWKVALGLQRLRKGSQVRALGPDGM
ncbi:putative Reticulocyte-binding protein 2 like protein a [Glarea lozoyensis 74030]|uniref:Putative Reticulocyte-binding protein 2 like protein a n=1 Tax=Glarea lozoyensis (strain ATCC 74030 / MF5533) TaxID=1104152 RepID=H0EFX2_GLAL7|nr:putative Reticulocyte-binding protein 2 like protein a [Glarea lozoyensis 74030]